MNAEVDSPAKPMTIDTLSNPDSGEVCYIGRAKDVWKR
jgi:hypothetical protein